MHSSHSGGTLNVFQFVSCKAILREVTSLRIVLQETNCKKFKVFHHCVLLVGVKRI